MEFKLITAITNANGELEFHAFEKEMPKIPTTLMNENSGYRAMYRQWEQSAQVFKAFSKEEVDKISRAAFKKHYSLRFLNNVDVTDFVVIEEYIGLALEGYFAFYKSPFGEEPSWLTDESRPEREPTYCQTCGGEVKVHGTKDGTHYFEPVGEAQESYTWADMEKAYVLGSFGQRLSVDELLKRIKDMPFNMADLKKTYLNLTRLPEA